MAADNNRGGAGPKAIAAMIGRITRATLGKRGFAEGGVIAEWPAVVGPHIAAHTCPLKIVFPRGERTQGTLHIRVASGGLATELQHLEPMILQRINGHFGYGAVARITLNQGPLPRKPKAAKPKAAPADEARAATLATLVEDDELRSALADLARHIPPAD